MLCQIQELFKDFNDLFGEHNVINKMSKIESVGMVCSNMDSNRIKCLL